MPAAKMVAQPEPSVTFCSRRDELVVLLANEEPIFGENGRQVGMRPSQRVEFRHGVLRVPRSGTVKLPRGQKADAAEVLQRLMDHDRLDDKADGFWVLPSDVPAPSEEEQTLVTTLGMDGDVAGLKELISQEEQGFGRPELLGPARAALVRVEEAAAAAKAAAEAAKKTEPAK